MLSDADVRRVVAEAQPLDEDFGRPFVMLLAATGARFRQVTEILVGDVQPEARRILVPVSSKGRGVEPEQHIAVPRGGRRDEPESSPCWPAGKHTSPYCGTGSA